MNGLFPEELLAAASRLIDGCRARRLMIASAESCTGGLIAALITSIAGSSDVFERGFVTYSNDAKCELLGVDPALIARYGAVSAEVAAAMAAGAITHSRAQLGVSVTGVAGPGGGTAQKPVGLVYVGTARLGQAPRVQAYAFGPRSRQAIRQASAAEALALLGKAIEG